MVRFILIAAAVAGLGGLGGCYRPSFNNCEITCHSNGDSCPSGMSCLDGFCTTGTTCHADAGITHDLIDAAIQLIDAMAIDAPMIDAPMIDAAMVDAPMIDAAMIDAAMIDAAMIDAPMIDAPMIDAAIDAVPIDAMVDAAVDAPPDAPPDAMVMVDAAPDATVVDAAPDAMIDAGTCPTVPSVSPCIAVGPPPSPPLCLTVCLTPTDPGTASMFNNGTWKIVKITSAGEEAAAVTALMASGQVSAWIGIDQMGGTPTSPIDGWHFPGSPPPLAFQAWATFPTPQPDDGDGTENGAENCAALTSNGWTDENCMGAMRPFLIQPN